MDAHGVDRAVLVPPLVSGFNNTTANAYALEGAAAHPDRLAVMGRFDPRTPDARERLAHWREQPGMLGVRFSLEGPPAPQLLEEGGPAMWEAFMEELRAIHMGQPQPARSVFGELRAAYEATVARRRAEAAG